MPKWKKKQLDDALIELERSKGKASVNATAKKYGIPAPTLHGNVKGKSEEGGSGKTNSIDTCRRGRDRILLTGVARNWLWADKGDCFFHCYRFAACKAKTAFFCKRTTWLGGGWNAFLKRWPKFVSRKLQHLSTKRATSANSVTIAGFYKNAEALYKKMKLSEYPDVASCIWNCNETCFNTAVGSQQVLAKRAFKWIHETGGGSGRENITVHICGSAAGEVLPPYTVYKGKHLYTSWTHHGPPGALYSASPSGWMEKDNFLKKLFIPRVKAYLASGLENLFFDGHHSHLSVQLITTCKRTTFGYIAYHRTPLVSSSH